MPSEHVSSCPSWCDPRVHHQHDSESPEHLTAGLTWKPVASDCELTVRTSRLDNTGLFGHLGKTLISLRTEDKASVMPGGEPIVVELDLDPADARMLAAALVVEAERVEKLQLAGAR